MNKKTFLSNLDSFNNFWKNVKNTQKNFYLKKGKPQIWLISSDYCFDKNKPSEVCTFTLFPYIAKNDMHNLIKNHLPEDIKKITGNKKILDNSLLFLKKFPSFYSVSIVLKNIKNLILCL